MTSNGKDGTPASDARLSSPRADAHELLRRGRRARAKRLALFMGIGVALPTLVAALYFGFIASDQFESTALLSVRAAPSVPSAGATTTASRQPSTASDRDTLLVRRYALSRAALSRLEAEHGFVAHYQDSGADIFSRLSDESSREEAYEYYRSKVGLDYDSASGTLSVSVTAYAPSDAARFAGALIKYSEELLLSLDGGPAPATTPALGLNAAALATTGQEGEVGATSSGDSLPSEVFAHGSLLGPDDRLASARTEQLPAQTRPPPRIAIIAAPSVAETATKPRRITSVLTVFALSATLLGIASLLIAALREHAKI